MSRIILASASPRRQELLRQIGLNFDIEVRPIDETLPDNLPPQQAVSEVAYRKASEVAGFVKDAVIIGADTVVVYQGQILGKPYDAAGAEKTLSSLSGSEHLVITGFCILDSSSGKSVQASETTKVLFRTLSDMEIRAYVNSGEPMDKAGSYGIQGLGAVLVERIEGCYFNVVGLPLTRLSMVLREFGIEVLT